MLTVSRLVQTKGNAVWSISPEATVYDALALMGEKDIGALMVMDGDRLVGVISERDYARKVALKGKHAHETSVREIMTGKVHFVRPDQTIEECMALMTDKRIRHLPVMENDKVIGVISIGDVVKALISDQEFRIQQLEQYITGTRK